MIRLYLQQRGIDVRRVLQSVTFDRLTRFILNLDPYAAGRRRREIDDRPQSIRNIDDLAIVAGPERHENRLIDLLT